jgi:CelD/BcsL family acetyltransferase involved in cellulose biosynthesis
MSMTTKLHVITGGELDQPLRERWREIQRSNAEFWSPYFCVEFTEAVAEVRRDVRIGVLESDRHVVGFFPHHRRPFGFARPLGLGLSDWHGVIVEPGHPFCMDAVLRGCRLVRWKYDHLIASQAPLVGGSAVSDISPIIELGRGLEDYLARRRELGGGELASIKRKAAKLKRSHGTYCFVEDDPEPAVLNRLIELKSAQCRRAGAFDYFSLPWSVELVRHLHGMRADRFGGVLSSLYVDGECVSAHFGMRSEHVWHWWLPSYEPSWSRHSPGMVLLWELLRTAAAQQLSWIDLGKGMSRYKSNLMTNSLPIVAGETMRKSLWRAPVAFTRYLKEADRSSPLRSLFRLPAGALRRIERRRRFT